MTSNVFIAVGVQNEIKDVDNKKYSNYVYDWNYFGTSIHNLLKLQAHIKFYYLPHCIREGTEIKNIEEGSWEVLADGLTLLQSKEQRQQLIEYGSMAKYKPTLHFVPTADKKEIEKIAKTLFNYYKVQEIEPKQRFQDLFTTQYEVSKQF